MYIYKNLVLALIGSFALIFSNLALAKGKPGSEVSAFDVAGVYTFALPVTCTGQPDPVPGIASLNVDGNYTAVDADDNIAATGLDSAQVGKWSVTSDGVVSANAQFFSANNPQAPGVPVITVIVNVNNGTYDKSSGQIKNAQILLNGTLCGLTTLSPF